MPRYCGDGARSWIFTVEARIRPFISVAEEMVPEQGFHLVSPALSRTHLGLSLLSELCGSLDQAAHYHIISV
jgi:hypothetical protein